MRVLVDTSIWSLALRRRAGTPQPADAARVHALAELLDDDRVVLVGPVRQELLSGIRDPATFELLRERLSAFADEPLVTEDWVEAACACNTCRGAGLAGSLVDFLLCGVALRRQIPIFTADQDFVRYAPVLGLRLLEPSLVISP